MSIPLWKLTKTFLLIKLIQLAIVYFTPCQFDTSSEIIINNLNTESPYPDVITTILKKLIVWDSVYFNDLFINTIKYEHTFVFSPGGWVALIRFLFKSESTTYFQLQFYSVLMSNLFHYLNMILLYQLTRITYDCRISELASIFMILSPAGIFLTGNYSENYSNFLTLLQIYLYFTSVNSQDFTKASNKSIRIRWKYIVSGIINGVNFTVRANSLLLGIIYLIDLYHFFIDWNIEECILSIITGGILFISFAGTNIYHYLLFCPGRGEWCNSTFPSLFQYSQDKYWNVGLFKYWTVNNIPNFLLVTPIIALNVYSIYYFYIHELPKYKRILSLVVVNGLIIIGGVFFWNTQILNRVTSFSPILYWTLAIEMRKGKKWVQYAMYYALMWNFIQSALFAAFMPPA
ncbi:GPI18 [[Candida] subhashii]|uniref:GPI mannosyltransferase 2 n=1 Tax=[Candida] subhashii TaxID=561895 RepID=A0A8J5QFP2_9ASCO|nr:GPI18 [[Candida] subhashii]KAG7660802.1 GPI18 [[Candida] subhashii]